MRRVLTLVSLTIFLTACGPVNVGTQPEGEVAAETKDKPKKAVKDESEEDAADPVTVTTTTTTTTTVGSEGAKKTRGRQIVGEYELVNDNAANSEFIGSNYCLGSNLRDCWIRSGYLTAYSDGTYEVAIEFWDTYSEHPYTVEDAKIEAEKALLLTDSAKLADDDTFSYKMLWAVVDPEARTLSVVYDWGSDGPGRQGDDLIEDFEFQRIDSEGN